MPDGSFLFVFREILALTVGYMVYWVQYREREKQDYETREERAGSRREDYCHYVVDWNDRDLITETTSCPLEQKDRLLQRVIVLQDFFGSRKELEKLYKEHGHLDILRGSDKTTNTYLTLKYGFRRARSLIQ